MIKPSKKKNKTEIKTNKVKYLDNKKRYKNTLTTEPKWAVRKAFRSEMQEIAPLSDSSI